MTRTAGGSGGSGFDDQWHRIRGQLRAEVGEPAFKSWLQPLTLARIDNGKVEIAVPTRFMRDWVVTHYADRIRALWSSENDHIQSVVLTVSPSMMRAGSPGGILSPEFGGDEEDAEQSVDAAAVTDTREVVIESGAGADRTDDFGAPLDHRFTFDNFVVGKPNELAHAAARRVAEATEVTFNPLFLYGGVGLGKTHLMHAIAWHIRAVHPERVVLYMSAEKFMYQFIRALRFKDTVSFKEMFRSVDVLMIDDVQFISGKESTQEEFFHTFNALVDQKHQVVVSADKSPSDLEGMEERLRSRLGWGLVADIHPTTYELRLGILQSKAEDQHTQIPRKVLEFLAQRITSNVRELEGALTRLVAHAEFVNRPITIETSQELLADLLRASEKRVTIDDIQKRVAEYYKVRLSDMSSARRSRSVVRPRQVAMFLAKQLTARSLPEIGRKFGGRDHTTVIHAVKRVEDLCNTDEAFAEDIELLQRILRS